MERRYRDEMQTLLKQYRDYIAEKINVELYRHDRYDIPFCLALFYAEDKEYIQYFSKHIRLTDSFFEVDEHMACIVFAHSDMNGAYKACQNIIHDYGFLHPEKRVYAGISSSERFNSDHELIRRAFDALNYARTFPESTVENDMTLFYDL